MTFLILLHLHNKILFGAYTLIMFVIGFIIMIKWSIEDGFEFSWLMFPVIFIGGKTDLNHLKEVSTKKAMNIAKIKHAQAFIECSSKTGENVNKIFYILASRILDNVKKFEGQ